MENKNIMQSFQRFKPLLVLILTAFLYLSSPKFSQAQTGYQRVAVDTLTKGVVHTHYKGTEDSLSIHVVKIDLTQPDLRIGVARAHNHFTGREKTSEIAKDHTTKSDSVLVATNADFFNLKTGANENNQVIDGQIVRGVPVTDSPYDTFDNIHSQFALTINSTPLIERFRFEGQVLASDKPVEIDGVNSSTDSSDAVLYNPYYGNFSPDSLAGKVGASFVLQQIKSNEDTVWYFIQRDINKGHQPIPHDGAVLYATDQSATELSNQYSRGDTLVAVLVFDPDYGKIETLTGGWPRIVRNGRSIAGKVDSIEGTFPKFSKVRHPRTGVGFSKDSTSVYLITVDGRQESSSGMSLEEFADFMLSVGIYQGLNLDGGGSTTMVIGGKVVNSPSDKTGERAVGNALLLYLEK